MPASDWTREGLARTEDDDAYSWLGHTLLGVSTDPVWTAAVILMVPGTQLVFRRSCGQKEKYYQEGGATYSWRGQRRRQEMGLRKTWLLKVWDRGDEMFYYCTMLALFPVSSST